MRPFVQISKFAPAHAYPPGVIHRDLKPANASAHASLGYYATLYAWDWELAKRSLDRAVELNWNYSKAHLYHVFYFLSQGDLERASASVNRAVQLDPLSPRTQHATRPRRRSKRRTREQQFLERVHLNAAGIDIGSGSHWVAVPADRRSRRRRRGSGG